MRTTRNSAAPNPFQHAFEIAADRKAKAPAPKTKLAVVEPETDAKRVYRLVGEGKFEEAAKLAARMINADNDGDLLTYPSKHLLDEATVWLDTLVSSARRRTVSGEFNITPARAQVLLERNEGNRRVDITKLADYMRDAVAGKWDLNGETLKVSKDGLLNDGQHRSFTSLLTGVSFKTIMVFGVEKETQRSVDIGKKRSGAERLVFLGEKDTTALNAISRLAFEVYNGRKPNERETGEYFGTFRDSILAANATRGSTINGIGTAPAGVSAMHLLSLGADAEDIKQFLKVIRTAEMVKSGNPAKTIHDALYPTKGASRGNTKPITMARYLWVSVLCHHFIAWKKGRKLHEIVNNPELPRSL